MKKQQRYTPEFRAFAKKTGTFVSGRQVERWVGEGQELGYLYDSFNGKVIAKVLTPGPSGGTPMKPCLIHPAINCIRLQLS